MNKSEILNRLPDRAAVEVNDAATRFLGKQPILDANLALYGQELLFRTRGATTFYGDPESATREVIDHYLHLMPQESPGVSFINCTREAIVSGLVTLLPTTNTVLEILETIEPDPEFIDACGTLKTIGYRFALDDFVPQESKLPLLEFADYIKVDFRASTQAERLIVYGLAKKRRSILIAEKIETASEMLDARNEGCKLFQGYFFAKPIIHEQRTIPKNQLTHVLLLVALSGDDYDLIEVEALIKSEASLCYRLLRLVNSARYATPAPIVSIGSAVMMVGQVELRKLVTVAMVGAFAVTQTEALSRMVLERARFCELLSPLIAERASKLYLLGMLSLIDTLMQIPMRTILESLPIDLDVKAALLGEQNHIGVALTLVRCYEACDWPGCDSLLRAMHLENEDFTDVYMEAIAWANRIICSDKW